MDLGIKENIIALVSLNRNITSASVPIFFVDNEEKQEETALLIAKITMGMVHDLRNGVYAIVKH
ncbi:capping complex subunit for YIEGIA [Paramaledivibacter caminithermalis]|jgi:hypothetical protein|uniref:Uncharacterized protein n=1 Tax=Paramaledivibacter caminithermalis (strain DSM 15212 / CIP 107654 / DViRD3) TaxID=1121301 RepID=A0A1M6S3K6_PARC5|nr:hypothetical protein [Paramaledivibacter caminithermalis]SHK39392.1 hypothetical protein SAMN02745912_03172 [Paramaledivibacter caminithermalis DSM 15212]